MIVSSYLHREKSYQLTGKVFLVKHVSNILVKNSKKLNNKQEIVLHHK